jgi:hypothetical protein
LERERNNFQLLRRGFVTRQGSKTDIAEANEAFSNAGLGQKIKQKPKLFFERSNNTKVQAK